MSISSRIYNLLIFKNFKHLVKINKFHKGIGSSSRFAQYIREKSNNYQLIFSDYSFSPHNPLIGPDRAMKWVCENYHAAFDYLDKNKTKSLLEIGCGYGISTWIMKDSVENQIVGIDINQEAIDGANKIFPEVKYECSDYLKYFDNNPDCFFDTIITCFGPVKRDHIDRLLNHCNNLIFIGYRARNFTSFLFRSHKNNGLQLSFSTTVIDKMNKNRYRLKYFKYYFTWHYFQSLIHAIKHKYFIPL
jgi:SAM-dependent methyltransferase